MDRMSECCGAQGSARATVPVKTWSPLLMGALCFTHPASVHRDTSTFCMCRIINKVFQSLPNP
jgi:hypothetical protein